MNQSLLTRLEIERFLFQEADLLDEQNYKQWLDLLTDDLQYWVPVVETYAVRSRTSNRVGGERESAYFNDSKTTLSQRIKRLDAVNAWAESPPSRTCRIISNVLVDTVGRDVFEVKSNFHLYRTRMQSDEDHYYGRRFDVVRRAAGGFAIARRKVVLTQAVLTSRNISTFF